ncbi:DUF4192 family protein [Tersicoccus sp. Bi-70]|uniref:DUF4192 family protein n=1 Tax=Tersicoccus sp. Bi-70 TaxID=1897634 RepID=UPI000976A82D|nr:DUF4192 family protein [Tersicoccus sp. Bi-70]OMH33176.1 hypothetical protein BGP79_06510 [Tersicoccus sp. Bi-70]
MTRSPATAIRSAEDLLAYVPHGLGHWPRESLVILADSGGEAGGLLRLDLPHRCTATLGAEIARYVGTVLAPGTPSGVFVVVYTAQRPRPGAGLPVLVHRLVRTLERLELTVRDCLYVTDGGWGHIDRSGSDVPWGRRRPLEDIAASVLHTEFVFAGLSWGSAPVDDVVPAATGPDADEIRRWATVHDPGARPDPPDADWVRRIGEVWDEVLAAVGAGGAGVRSAGGCAGGAGRPSPGVGRATMPPAGAGAPAPFPVSAETAGLLLAGLRSRTVRDLLLFQSAVGPSPVIPELLLGDGRVRTHARPPAGAERTAEACAREATDRDACLRTGGMPLLASVITGTVALTPDWSRLDAAHRMLEALAPHAQGEARCATLTLLGWIEFARGRGSRAHRCLDAALQVDGGYELARLFDRFLDLGQVHEWARHRTTAWRGGHPDAA